MAVKCGSLRHHLESLIITFGLTELARNSTPLYDCGYLRAGSSVQIVEAIKSLTAELRPQYIPDGTLNSAIGNSYGDIYENYINLAANSRLNRSGSTFAKGIKEYMLPVLTGKL